MALCTPFIEQQTLSGQFCSMHPLCPQHGSPWHVPVPRTYLSDSFSFSPWDSDSRMLWRNSPMPTETPWFPSTQLDIVWHPTCEQPKLLDVFFLLFYAFQVDFHTGSRDVLPLFEMSHIKRSKEHSIFGYKLWGLLRTIDLYGLKETSSLTFGTTQTLSFIPDSCRESTQNLLVGHPIWKNIQFSLKLLKERR